MITMFLLHPPLTVSIVLKISLLKFFNTGLLLPVLLQVNILIAQNNLLFTYYVKHIGNIETSPQLKS